MKIVENVDLSKYSTMRVGGKAKYFAEIESVDDLSEAVEFTKEKSIPLIMIGGGSNLIWQDKGFEGLVIINRIKGKKIINEDKDSAIVELASGEDWDRAVQWSVDKNLSGIEQLSFIPGRVGATPVQNVGAYGREVADVLVSIKAYDTLDEKFVTIDKKDCDFGYRTSRFKTKDKGRFLITAVVLKLSKHSAKPPFYASLEKWLEENNVTDFSPKNIRKGVIAIRTKKLPDPDIVANNGSFFANPIISYADFEDLKIKFPDVASWPTNDDKVKISAGWLIENAGFKDFHDKETGMATWDKQSLVLINERAKSSDDVMKFKQKIVNAVQEKFGIKLEQEPEII